MTAPGDRYGMLTVVRRGRDGANWHKFWFVRCDCGKETEVRQAALRNGRTSSCGKCKRLDTWRKKYPSGPPKMATQLLHRYKIGAKKRGIEWIIEDEIFFALIKDPCTYCGAPPANVLRYKGHEIVYSGIDRMDNSLGYLPGNTHPCCAQCNRGKRDHTADEFVQWAHRVAAHTPKNKYAEADA